MSILRAALPPHRIQLGLRAASLEEAIERILESLRDAPEVRDFPGLAKAVRQRNATVTGSPGREILVSHGRTECVDRLVLSAGRLEKDGRGAGLPRLVFVAGIPAAFSTEYLRAVGAIARACSSPGGYEAQISAASAAEFLALLEAAEHTL